MEERNEPEYSALNCNLVVCEQKDDQLSDGQDECCDIFYEYRNQYVENNCLPFSFSSFKYLKQRLKYSKQAHKTEEFHVGETEDFQRGYQLVVMNFLRHMGEQLEFALHSNPSIDKQEGNHPSDVHEKVILTFICSLLKLYNVEVRG